MKKKLLLAAILVFTVAAAFAQTVTKQYDFGHITGINASVTYKIHITKGDSHSIEVICPEELESYLDIKSMHGILYLRTEPPRNARHLNNSAPDIIVNMQMNNIHSIDLAGASSVSVAGTFTTDRLTCDLSGSSSCKISNISGKSIKIDCSGSSTISQTGDFEKMDLDCSGANKCTVQGNMGEIVGRVSGSVQFSYTGNTSKMKIETSGIAKATFQGTAQTLEFNCSGASQIHAKEMHGKNVTIELTGASKANVYASEILRENASAASLVNYYGNPAHTVIRPTNVRKAD